MWTVERARISSYKLSEHIVTLFRSLSFVSVLFPLAAAAVIIDSGDGTENTSAPADDPGWANIGIRGSLTAVYLRNGWVLTANHVGIGDLLLDGGIYVAVPGSGTQLDNGDGTFADLMVFAITPIPTLPDLEIRSNASLPTGEVILAGRGRNRGAASDSDDPGIWTPPPPNPAIAIEGWYWGGGATLRWGTNTVEDYWTDGNPDTVSFYTSFDEVGDPDHTEHECQAAHGDSGGALFAKDGTDWELAGILWASGLFAGQNVNTSALRGNATLAADLSFYRDDIMSLTATPVPEPSVVLQLGAGAALVACMTRRRGHRRQPETAGSASSGSDRTRQINAV